MLVSEPHKFYWPHWVNLKPYTNLATKLTMADFRLFRLGAIILKCQSRRRDCAALRYYFPQEQEELYRRSPYNCVRLILNAMKHRIVHE